MPVITTLPALTITTLSPYVVSGVLPDVSSELHVSLTAAGQLATAFSLAYAVGAPILSTLTGRWERRTLLIAALSALAVTDPALAREVGSHAPLLIVLASLVVGGIIGSLLRLEQRVESLGGWLQSRLSGASDLAVGLWTAVPFTAAAIGMIMVAAHSDRTGDQESQRDRNQQ